VERVINGVKNNQAAGTELLYLEIFKYGENEIKND